MVILILMMMIVSSLQLAHKKLELNSDGQQTEDGDIPIQNNVCVKGKSIKTPGLCLSKDNILSRSNALWDSELCAGLDQLFGQASVVDFASLFGHYGRCLLRINNNIVNSNDKEHMTMLDNKYRSMMKFSGLYNKPKVIETWRGYDKAENIEEISAGFVKHLDLTKKQDLKERWDWAVSIEVGKHIPAESEDIFIDNVARHACKGIVLSWAVPAMLWSGDGHINIQYNNHIIEQMKKRGFHQAQDKQRVLRRNLRIPFLTNTIMVFTSDNESRCT